LVVSCTSADNCWAVGHDTTKLGNLNQVLHWTGKKWFHVAVPTPAGTGRGDNNELFAVRCTLASDCWAVGDSERSHSVDLDVALHWNGQKWRQVDTPAPGGRRSGDFNDLDDVSCTSAASCWAALTASGARHRLTAGRREHSASSARISPCVTRCAQ